MLMRRPNKVRQKLNEGQCVMGSALRTALNETPGSKLTVDLNAQTVMDSNGAVHSFDIDPFSKDALLKGLDEIRHDARAHGGDRRIRAPLSQGSSLAGMSADVRGL